LKKLRCPADFGEEHMVNKMIRLGRSSIVKAMIELDAETNLDPQPLQQAIDAQDYDVCKTLMNIQNKSVNMDL
jgi:hypothetical protein